MKRFLIEAVVAVFGFGVGCLHALFIVGVVYAVAFRGVDSSYAAALAFVGLLVALVEGLAIAVLATVQVHGDHVRRLARRAA